MSKTRIKVHVSDVDCPVCGSPEVNPTTKQLNIRAFKVSDKHGWWSHCLLEHGIQTINGTQTHVKDLWFCNSSIAKKVIVEIGSNRYVWES